MAASSKNANDHTNVATERTQEGVRQAADAARRTTETMQQTAQAAWNTASDTLRRTTGQVTEAFGLSGRQTQELADQSSRNLEAMAQCGNVLARGFQDISREWVELAQDRLRRNLEGFDELARCRSVPDLVAVQTRLMRDTMESVLNNSRRIAEISMQVTDEASQTIAGRVEESAARARRAA